MVFLIMNYSKKGIKRNKDRVVETKHGKGFKLLSWDFPGGPVVKTSSSNAGGAV